MKLKAAYIGTPDFSARVLESLAASSRIGIVSVYTQPDKPVGRKQIVTPSPVKQAAERLHLPVYEDLASGPGFAGLDIALAYAYGQIIPAEFLQQPKWGFVNLHPSLLPKFRGPSPIAYSLIFNEKKTGVTLMQMDEKIDHGPVVRQAEINIAGDEMRPQLEERLSELGSKLILELAGEIQGRNLTPPLPSRPQNGGEVSFSHILTKKDGFIRLEILQAALKNAPLPPTSPEIFAGADSGKYHWSAQTIFNLYRGLYPWPGIWTLLPDNRRLKITGMRLEGDRIQLTKVQLEGKNEVDFPTFNKAYRIFV